jgi:hypothetical protein
LFFTYAFRKKHQRVGVSTLLSNCVLLVFEEREGGKGAVGYASRRTWCDDGGMAGYVCFMDTRKAVACDIFAVIFFSFALLWLGKKKEIDISRGLAYIRLREVAPPPLVYRRGGKQSRVGLFNVVGGR